MESEDMDIDEKMVKIDEIIDHKFSLLSDEEVRITIYEI